MGEALASPASLLLASQIGSVRFMVGEDEGRWRVLKLDFPHLYVRVTGRDHTGEREFSHDFHLECTGYPDPGPFVERWCYADDEKSGSRPPAPSVGSPGFIDALKEWSPEAGGPCGIYRAWERKAAVHNDWAGKRPEEAWRRDREITFIMEQLYALVSEQADWLASQR